MGGIVVEGRARNKADSSKLAQDFTTYKDVARPPCDPSAGRERWYRNDDKPVGTLELQACTPTMTAEPPRGIPS